jgi:hypothetical protein
MSAGTDAEIDGDENPLHEAAILYRRSVRSAGSAERGTAFSGLPTLPGMNALVVGHAEPAAALTSALSERGLEAELHAFPRPPEDRAVASLAESLVDLERRLIDERPALAIGVGTGDASLALAITAAKLGVPLVAWVEDTGSERGELELAEARILATLADFDAGPVGDGAAAFEAAERIASWVNLELDAS